MHTGKYYHGTSLATKIPLAFVGGVIKLIGGYVDPAAGLLLAAGTVIGAQASAAVIKRFEPRIFRTAPLILKLLSLVFYFLTQQENKPLIPY